MFGKSKIDTDPKKIDELLTRGVEEVIDRELLKKELLSGKQLRIKLGIDPTSPNLHIGRSVPLLKLRDFQKLGHKVVFIVGDFTGIIGDASDKDAERPMLSKEVLEKNMETYKKQAAKILDIGKVEFVHNSSWLEKLDYYEIGKQADVFSINQFISRENVGRRLKEGKRVSLREVLYPLMQGYDSVAVKADVELGGTDQRFNLLSGRDIQVLYGQQPQNVVMTSLIEGLDGRKMSSSWGNTVNFNDAPNDMYGKIMSLRDDFIISYFTTMTRIPFTEVFEIAEQLKAGNNPKEIKMRLAREIVSMYHGADEATKAQAQFEKTFSKGEIPEETKKVTVKIKMPLADLLVQQGLVKSKAEFRRLVEEGAIKFHGKIEERKIIDPQSLVEESGDLRIGKRRFLKITVTKEN